MIAHVDEQCLYEHPEGVLQKLNSIFTQETCQCGGFCVCLVAALKKKNL